MRRHQNLELVNLRPLIEEKVIDGDRYSSHGGSGMLVSSENGPGYSNRIQSFGFHSLAGLTWPQLLPNTEVLAVTVYEKDSP